MASSNIKFSNNSQSLSFTFPNVSANGNDTKVSQLSGYSTSSISGKTINQIEIVSSTGGTQKLTVKVSGQSDTKTAVSPGFGNNIINFSPAVDAGSLTIDLAKQ